MRLLGLDLIVMIVTWKEVDQDAFAQSPSFPYLPVVRSCKWRPKASEDPSLLNFHYFLLCLFCCGDNDFAFAVFHTSTHIHMHTKPIRSTVPVLPVLFFNLRHSVIHHHHHLTFVPRDSSDFVTLKITLFLSFVVCSLNQRLRRVSPLHFEFPCRPSPCPQP